MAMGKVQPRYLSEKKRKELERELRLTLEGIRKREDLIAFVFDLLTDSEQVMFARRIQVAKLLLQGASYVAIINKLHVGQDTIERVDKWLVKKFADYRDVLPPLFEEKRKGPIDPHSLRGVIRRYPLYFPILSTLLEDMEKERC